MAMGTLALSPAQLTRLGQLPGPVLALDASTPIATIALASGGPQPVVDEVAPSAMALPSESLFAALMELLEGRRLAIADLSGIVVGLGPGSFTGLRVALASAKGLALGSDRPLYGTSSLALAAAAVGPGTVVVIRDARRASCYIGMYAVDELCCTEVLAEERVCAVAALPSVAAELQRLAPRGEPLQFAGDFLERIEPARGLRAHVAPVVPRAIHAILQEAPRIARQAPDNSLTLGPRYLQTSCAAAPKHGDISGAKATS